MPSRRTFLKMGAAAGAGVLLPTMTWRAFASVTLPQTPLAGADIPQFVEPLTTFVGRRVSSSSFNVAMQEFQQKVLPDSMYSTMVPPFNQGTYVWGYKVDSRPSFFPGFTVEAQRGTATSINYINNLPFPNNSHLEPLFTIDQTIHWADPLGTGSSMHMGSFQPYQGTIPTVVHLHGAEVPSAFDGAPEAWFTQDGIHGKGYSSLFHTSGNAAVYRYPNTQQATTLWFHDHALGMTRINVFSGLAAMYLLRDQFDTGRSDNSLRLPAGNQEIELIIQDRQFDTNGQLLFPDGTPADNPTGLNGTPPNPGAHPFWIPEFFGDAIVVNGKTWPFLSVEPRRYRFRFLNASNARFYQMTLLDSSNQAPGPALWQIGTDGGLLDRPVKLSDPNNPNSLQLFLAPSERGDIIIDFAGHAGHNFTLTNSAVAPFPSGDAPDPATNGVIMQFRVNLPLSSQDTTYNPASGAPLRGRQNQEPVIVRLANPTNGTLGTGVRPSVTRQLALVEAEGPGGPLEVLINNSKWTGVHDGTTTPIPGSVPASMGQPYFFTEQPRVGATEVWEIANLTMDAHPIHIHLIQFQVINRQNFDVDNYRPLYDSKFPGGTFEGLTSDGTLGLVHYDPGVYIPGYGPPRSYLTPNADGAIGGIPALSPFLQGKIILPDANEAGWKDTLKMYPGEVTRIAIRWAPIDTQIGAVRPGQNLYTFDPTAGPGYVWHCHILDHEDNEMMRGYTPTF
ncbi:MAG TPA: multicopper oxidase domain-containing protein [Ktedonobacteraceae bacterium]